MQLFRVVVSVFLVVAPACTSSREADPAQGGPELAASGLDRGLPLGQLDGAQRASLCTWETDGLGGPGFMQVCEECTGNACADYNVTVNTVEMCLAQLDQLASCDVTVGQQEDCVIAQARDLCSIPVECDALSACL